MQLKDIADDVRLTPKAAVANIRGLTADSRAVKPGFLFAALKGAHADGTRFIADACRNGASAILVGTDADAKAVASAAGDCPVVTSEDPRRSLALMAAAFYGYQPGTMVAVTGTSGKTSVAVFVRQIYAHAGFEAASLGTIGTVTSRGESYGGLTTPDPVTLQRDLARLSDDGITHAAMEASSHGLDQRRLDGVAIQAAAFTNLGRDHLDYHPDVESYLKAKLRLFDTLLPEDGTVVVEPAAPHADRVIEAAKARGLRLFTVGEGGDALKLDGIEHDGFIQVLSLTTPDGPCKVRLPLVGRFQASNALIAAGLAIATGVPTDVALTALEGLQGAPGRLEKCGEKSNGALVFVDYAHKPDALENALGALRPFTTGRLIAVIGAGGDRDPGKRPLMGKAAHDIADVVIVTDDNPRSEDPAKIRRAVLSGAPGAIEIGDRGEAIAAAVAMMESGDVLCIAGKGHETGQIVGDRVIPFSDHEAVAEALAREAEAMRNEHAGKSGAGAAAGKSKSAKTISISDAEFEELFGDLEFEAHLDELAEADRTREAEDPSAKGEGAAGPVENAETGPEKAAAGTEAHVAEPEAEAAADAGMADAAKDDSDLYEEQQDEAAVDALDDEEWAGATDADSAQAAAGHGTEAKPEPAAEQEPVAPADAAMAASDAKAELESIAASRLPEPERAVPHSAALWTLEEFLAATGGRVVGAPAGEIVGISIDSRTLAPGEAFFAIKGDVFDGHQFVKAAIDSGAAIAVVGEAKTAELPAEGPYVAVDDPLEALVRLGLAARARTSARIVAVTGSVGKTGTKEMLRLALSRSGPTHAAVASFNNHWGVPLTLARMPRDSAFAVFEIGMNHAGEITPLVKMVRPHVAVITTVQPVHLEFFGSVEKIAAAKAEIFTGIEPGGTAILNRDNDQFDLLMFHARMSDVEHVRTFGVDHPADARAHKVSAQTGCTCISATVMGHEIAYKVGAPGFHYAKNSLAVLAAVHELGADLALAGLALADMRAPKGRGAQTALRLPSGKATLIDESYNANPASMRAALRLLGETPVTAPGRRIAVLGDMRELGEASGELHAALAEAVLSAHVDLVYCAGPHMHSLWDALPTPLRGAYSEESKGLRPLLLNELRPGDVVMIKGSLGTRMGPLVDALTSEFPAADEAAE